MKTLLASLNGRGRDFACWQIAGLLNWISAHIIAPECEAHPDVDTRLLRFGWWLESRLSELHGWFCEGSNFEIELAVDGCIPARYLNDRQRAAVLDAFPNLCASCNSCQWVGFTHQAEDNFCPSCGSDSIHWIDRSQAWVPYTDKRAIAVHLSPARVPPAALRLQRPRIGAAAELHRAATA